MIIMDVPLDCVGKRNVLQRQKICRSRSYVSVALVFTNDAEVGFCSVHLFNLRLLRAGILPSARSVRMRLMHAGPTTMSLEEERALAHAIYRESIRR